MKKILIFLSVLLLATACQQAKKERTSGKEPETQTKKETHVAADTSHTVNNSLTRLVLRDSVFYGTPEKIEIKVINNSTITLTTGNGYRIKRFEFGNWSTLPAFLEMIWTDEGYDIEPESERIFMLDLYFIVSDLEKGKYRIEKDVYVSRDRYTLTAEFYIK